MNRNTHPKSQEGIFWKTNLKETQKHFIEWWRGEGLVLWLGYVKASSPQEEIPKPLPAKSLEQRYLDPAWRAQTECYAVANQWMLADTLPVADTCIGPGTLSTFLGAEPELTESTVWYRPCITNPENHPPLVFNPQQKWWKIHEAIIREMVKTSRGRYYVGCPDLIENIDTLASLRDSEKLMMDMIDRPEWVKERLAQINQAFFDAYSHIYDLIKMPEGDACFSAYSLWAPGKVAKVQCDASAMFSPSMFEEFVVPSLTEQCAWLDYSMYHLDGTQCICHLDHLLSIPQLNAIEWTPEPRVPEGGDPKWYDMYRRILKAGKSVQAQAVKIHELIPLLDAVGPKGMYIQTCPKDEAEAEKMTKMVEAYR
jgi:hypothetical protein